MLKLCGLCLFMVQLGLTSGMNADWGVQMTLLNRKFRNNKAADLELVSKTWCQRISRSANLTFQGLCSSNQAGSVSDAFQSEMMLIPKHTTNLEVKTNHQVIVIMERDPTVIESATYLFERHFTISTLLMYNHGKLDIVRGSHFLSTAINDVILVGHGRVSSHGTVQLAGLDPSEIATFVLKSELIFGHRGTISLISCNLASDRQFILQLLQVFQSYNVKATLHLYDSLVSVTSEGKLLTGANGVWTSQDHSRKIIAELDQGGRLLTKTELGCTGPVFPEYKGRVLYLQTLEWPNHPRMFVPAELRKKYPSIDCLEGLTWSLFFEENERRRAPNYVPDNQRTLKAVWLTEPRPEEDTTHFKHISTIQDLLVEIRYNAREEIASNLYYVLNECIYKMNGRNLNVSLVGKFMNIDNQAEIERFQQSFGQQQGWSSLHDLRQGLKASKFNDFCRQTFQFQQCSYNCERWGHYFMVAVFTASVRNFRTFSLFLMTVIGCEVGRKQGIDSSLCTAFVGDDHPMVADQPWPEEFHRGFYGCTVENYDLAPQDKQLWLEELVAKENALYVKSKQLMNGVYHDEQTELDIFGRVKVMNKYVFSSYLEFFRGTPEGRSLKRGCTVYLNEKFKP